MRNFGVRLLLGAVLLAPLAPLPAQRSFSGAAEIEQSLHKLNELGTILHIAAHPDDERTAVLAYFARGRHMRTAYLSLTRGEGGQNLIGSEQGAQLGIIRTQELLAARQIDGGQDMTLSGAVLVYQGGNDAFAVWHPAKHGPAEGAPYLGAAEPLTMEFLRALSTGLGVYVAPEILQIGRAHV